MNAPPTIEEIKAIVLAEKAYWDKADPDLGIAAVAACANIFAAIYGLRAPWHPQIENTPTECCPRDVVFPADMERI